MNVSRSSLSLLVSSLLSLATVVPAAAQGTSGIRGNVVDKDGQPIVGAVVSVVNPDLRIQTGGVTDAKGEFRIAPLPPGKGYTLTASFPWMGKIALSDIEVPANRVLVVPVTLRSRNEPGCTGWSPRAQQAQETVVGIQGGVFDQDGQPVVGVTVSVSNPDRGIATAGLTDGKGEFRIAPLPPGKGYSLSVSDRSKGSASKAEIEVPADRVFLVSITLRP